jgi:hypothetical protein
MACQDRSLEPTTPLEPAAERALKPSFNVSGSAVGTSTVCAAYRADLEAAVDAGDATAADVLQEIVSDSCEQ